MKRLLLAGALTVLAIFVLVPAATAQRSNSLEAGAWTLQFGVEGEFIRVDSFGSGLAIKHHFTPKSAVRANVSFGFTDTSRDVNLNDNLDDSSAKSVRLGVLYQRYVNPAAEANLYWTAGPTANYGRSDYNYASGDSVSADRAYKTWGVGVEAGLGVEWFATRVISFQAEYVAQLGFVRLTRTETRTLNESTTVVETSDDTWSASTDGTVRFGMSVYF